MKKSLDKHLILWLDHGKSPSLAMLLFVLLISVWKAGPGGITKEAFSGLLIVLILFAVVMVYKDIWFKRQKWLYYVIQGIIVFDIAVVMEVGFEVAYIGLLPMLVYEGLLDCREKFMALVIAVLYYGVFSGLIIYLEGVDVLLSYLPILGLTTFAVLTFNGMYQKQIELQRRSKKHMYELQEANMAIESLTLERERQRVARDLHDTLSQGLTALVLYMETMEVYLDQGNEAGLRKMLDKGTNHARLTLSEARQVLDDLRAYEARQIDFRKLLDQEIHRFQELFTGHIRVEGVDSLLMDEDQARQLKFVSREILGNVQKHAKAKSVHVVLHQTDNQMNLRITDDGIGMDMGKKWQQSGHYGLTGMRERVKHMGGQLDIYSEKRKGTTVEVLINHQEGEVADD